MDSGLITFEDKKTLLHSLRQHATEQMPMADVENFGVFIELFLENYPLDTLLQRRVSDVFWAVYGLWHCLLNVNGQYQPVIQIFNPGLEEHKWSCSKTVVQVLQRDMPFLVDSMRMELAKADCLINVQKSTVLHIKRSAGRVVGLASGAVDPPEAGYSKEAIIYAEVNLQTDEKSRLALIEKLERVFYYVETVVDDYVPMLAKLADCSANIEKVPGHDSEAVAFLAWMNRSHFTFLGCREYDWIDDGGRRGLLENPKKRLGFFKTQDSVDDLVWEENLSLGMREFQRTDQLIGISKSATRARVHRGIYPDYVVVKKMDEKGKVCGEVRFLGMFTYAVYSMSTDQIPLVRQKVSRVMVQSGLDPYSHHGKNFRRVIENYPRDELFQSNEKSLYTSLKVVLDINERHVIKLIMREDSFGNFANFLLYVPRDLYNTDVRIKIQSLIGDALKTHDSDSTTFFSESMLARAQFVFRLRSDKKVHYSVEQLEGAIGNIVRDWGDYLQSSLIEEFGETAGIKYLSEYKHAFTKAYQEYFDARIAARDIRLIENLKSPAGIVMKLYQPVGAPANKLYFRLLRLHQALALSDVIPILEHLGLRVLSEHPFHIEPTKGSQVWVHEYELWYPGEQKLNVLDVKENFEEACLAVWDKRGESDAFNKLVLAANLHWREVVMLRAYARYMKQTVFSASHDYIAETLVTHAQLTQKLTQYYDRRFNPDGRGTEAEITQLREQIGLALDNVENLNEDRVLRRYVQLIDATLRTNFYQLDEHNQPKYWLSTKFNPREIPGIPEPRPAYEIFVYSPRVEGVHLRGGKVARGGLRWSDRIQDYRTEVLGLVKAQQVKNAVIVPEGAKGGFVAKDLLVSMSRDQMHKEGVACYRIFIRGLLDITDNLVEGKVIPPKRVERHDDDDPYLVVAADKGTATFSDIANAISEERQHWLGDAFASGGSQGYDHKGMGITAKGAWISVQRHFRGMGTNIQEEDFSVIGIGDMGGDVFGNGMLLSEHIRLLAAFNHLHIFIDPNPSAAKSFLERKRMFETPRVTWENYDSALLSQGGGVFSRQAKSIDISPEAQAVFDISATRLTPNELIHALLKAPVDLIWNGGIGTYIKSSRESHAEVGDKANDALRVDGKDLRCKVFGEGGNLGATQLGRVEFCFNGGACNTDFIDNAAGVDCSDHEVNIKILLDTAVRAGDLTGKQRNAILANMTEEVSELVLHNNYLQTQALSVAQFQAKRRMNEYRRFICYLENLGKLDRRLEFLPADEVIVERQSQGGSFTRPELSVLISYAKVLLKNELGQSDIADDPYILEEIETAFPATLREKYLGEIQSHRLKKEIVATQVANNMINNLGITAGHRLIETTGASFSDIAKAYIVSRDVFRITEFNAYIQQQDNVLPARFQAELLGNMMRRVRRGTRWFLRNRRESLNPQNEVQIFRQGLDNISAIVADVVEGNSRQDWLVRKQDFVARGVAEVWAERLATPDNLFSGLGVVEAALQANVSNMEAAEIFYALLDRLNLSWFAAQLTDVKVESYWQAIARESFIDDLGNQLRKLTITLVQTRKQNGSDVRESVDAWEAKHRFLVDRWKSMLEEVLGTQVTDYAMFSVALKELIDLAETTSLS